MNGGVIFQLLLCISHCHVSLCVFLRPDLGRIYFCGAQSRKNVILAKRKRMTIGKNEWKNQKEKNTSKQGVIVTPNSHFQSKMFIKSGILVIISGCFCFCS